MVLPQIRLQSQVESYRVLCSDQCINNIYVGLNNFISKFVDDTQIGNSIITDHDRMGLQDDLRKISDWSQRWEMPFNVNKCHILQVR